MDRCSQLVVTEKERTDRMGCPTIHDVTQSTILKPTFFMFSID